MSRSSSSLAHPIWQFTIKAPTTTCPRQSGSAPPKTSGCGGVTAVSALPELSSAFACSSWLQADDTSGWLSLDDGHPEEFLYAGRHTSYIVGHGSNALDRSSPTARSSPVILSEAKDLAAGRDRPFAQSDTG